MNACVDPENFPRGVEGEISKFKGNGPEVYVL